MTEKENEFPRLIKNTGLYLTQAAIQKNKQKVLWIGCVWPLMRMLLINQTFICPASTIIWASIQMLYQVNDVSNFNG